MIGRGQHGLESSALDDARDFARIGGDDKSIADAQLSDATSHMEDQGIASQWQKWLAREPAGAQPCRNHAKDGHGGRYKIGAGRSRPWLPVVGQLDLAAFESSKFTISATVQTRSVSPAAIAGV